MAVQKVGQSQIYNKMLLYDQPFILGSSKISTRAKKAGVLSIKPMMSYIETED